MRIETVFSNHYGKISFLRKRKRHYLQTSTVHGVPKTLSENNTEYFFWLLVVLVGMTLSLMTAFHSISKYYTYEVYTSISRRIVDKHRFPSVTFCDECGVIENSFSYCGVKYGRTHSNPDLPCSTFPQNYPQIQNVLNSTSEWSNGLFHVRSCASTYHTYGARKKCVSEQYLKSIRKHNNYCFTWNYAGDFSDESGRVDLTFSLNQSSRHNFSQLYAIVHDPQVTELEQKNRIFIEPNKNYQFKIKTVETHRLKHPFPSNCTDGKPNDFLPGKYTRTKCVESINYLGILKHCGDILDYYKRIIPKDLIRKYQRNISINEALECFYTYSRRTVNTTDTCPVPCKEVEINTISTFHNMEAGYNSSFAMEIVHGSYDSYSVVQERPLHTWEQIAGDVGGILGVIIGISFVSMIELLVCMVLFILEKISLCIMYYNSEI